MSAEESLVQFLAPVCGDAIGREGPFRADGRRAHPSVSLQWTHDSL